jgi:hypothetical protein
MIWLQSAQADTIGQHPICKAGNNTRDSNRFM